MEFKFTCGIYFFTQAITYIKYKRNKWMISRIQHPLCILNMGYFKFIVGFILNVNKAVKIFMLKNDY